jgi:hypothetical protein
VAVLAQPSLLAPAKKDDRGLCSFLPRTLTLRVVGSLLAVAGSDDEFVGNGAWGVGTDRGGAGE